MANIVSSALMNYDLFGKYKINHIFILLGKFLGCNHGSTASTLLTNMVKEALESTNLDKEIQPYSFYCTDTVESLTQPKMGKKVFSYETFFQGIIHQVSRGTYGISVIYLKDMNNDTEDGRKKLGILCQTDNMDGLMKTTKVGPAPFLHKGQPISSEKEIQKVFYIEHTGEFDEYVHSSALRIGIYSPPTYNYHDCYQT